MPQGTARRRRAAFSSATSPAPGREPGERG